VDLPFIGDVDVGEVAREELDAPSPALRPGTCGTRGLSRGIAFAMHGQLQGDDPRQHLGMPVADRLEQAEHGRGVDAAADADDHGLEPVGFEIPGDLADLGVDILGRAEPAPLPHPTELGLELGEERRRRGRRTVAHDHQVAGSAADVKWTWGRGRSDHRRPRPRPCGGFATCPPRRSTPGRELSQDRRKA
jgi:hypothetical protein